jgi:hypothetical protein
MLACAISSHHPTGRHLTDETVSPTGRRWRAFRRLRGVVVAPCPTWRSGTMTTPGGEPSWAGRHPVPEQFQPGKGRKLGAPYGADRDNGPVRAVQDWLDASGIRGGLLVRSVDRHEQLRPGRLSDKAVALVVKRAARGRGSTRGATRGTACAPGWPPRRGRGERAEHHGPDPAVLGADGAQVYPRRAALPRQRGRVRRTLTNGGRVPACCLRITPRASGGVRGRAP